MTQDELNVKLGIAVKKTVEELEPMAAATLDRVANIYGALYRAKFADLVYPHATPEEKAIHLLDISLRLDRNTLINSCI